MEIHFALPKEGDDEDEKFHVSIFEHKDSDLLALNEKQIFPPTTHIRLRCWYSLRDS